VAASRWLAGERFEHEQFHPQVQRALDQATRPLMRYRCAACGFEAHQHPALLALPRLPGLGQLSAAARRGALSHIPNTFRNNGERALRRARGRQPALP